MISSFYDLDLLLWGCVIPGEKEQNNGYDAVAIKNGRIVALGKMAELGQIAAREKIDLHGKTLLPGFIDAHTHLMLYAMVLRHVDCRLPLDGDLNDVLQRIQNTARDTPAGEWIRGWGFADYKVKQRRFLTRQELDEAAPNHPVAVLHASWHSAIVNSRALAQLQIDDNTPDPPGGRIERHPTTGEPNGILHETAMQAVSFDSMMDEFSRLDMDEQIYTLRQGIKHYTSLGVTTVCESQTSPTFLRTYQVAERQGELKCRVVPFLYYEWNQAFFETGLLSGFGSERLKLGPVKLMGDGSLSGRTAAVSQPFVGSQDTGILYRDQPVLDALVHDFDARGFQIAIHAIGDRAVQQVVNAYEKVINKSAGNINRHRVEHAGILNPELIRRMADLDLVVSVQPRMLYEQGDGFLKSCGEQRIHWVYPYLAQIEAGVHVAGSSDCPVVSPDPLLGMQAAALRKTEGGEVLAPEQCVSPRQALHMFTQEAAYSLFCDDDRGSVEVGKLADLTVLSNNPLCTPAAAWGSEVVVEMTLVNGEVVYQKDQN